MRDRVCDCAILLTVSALLTLPNLGVPSLWDMDEGVNAQTSREMQSSETWVIPTFNYHLRTAKPVMLYWLQRLSYDRFGANEWSARLPSALAGWLSVLMAYELARRMFDRATGLHAGLILVSIAQFGILAHAATPDATLLAFTILAYLVFWAGHLNGARSWWLPMAAANALAFLTKGPIGLALPTMVVILYFAWNREIRRLFDRRAIWATLLFLVIAGPWYGLVTSETRGEWLRSFLNQENISRFLTPKDRHAGWFGYYLVIVPVMFAPWCAFLLPLFWYGITSSKRRGYSPGATFPGWWSWLIGRKRLKASPSGSASLDLPGGTARAEQPTDLSTTIRASRFLLCWITTYFVFFSASATKLPNYLFPIYPAMAILAARFLVCWRDGQLAVPRWMIWATVGGMFLVGVVCVIGVFVADRTFPGLSGWAVLGVIPLAAAITMGICLRRGNRGGFVTAVTVASLAFMGMLVTFPALAIEPYKAPKELVRMSGVDDPNRDLRLGEFEWLLPSVVYYSGREVQCVPSPQAVGEFLAVPTPAYLFVAESTWNRVVAQQVTVPCRIVARHYDFFHKGDIVVVTNEMSQQDK